MIGLKQRDGKKKLRTGGIGKSSMRVRAIITQYFDKSNTIKGHKNQGEMGR